MWRTPLPDKSLRHQHNVVVPRVVSVLCTSRRAGKRASREEGEGKGSVNIDDQDYDADAVLLLMLLMVICILGFFRVRDDVCSTHHVDPISCRGNEHQSPPPSRLLLFSFHTAPRNR